MHIPPRHLVHELPMLSFQEFFTVCAGSWQIERTYHSLLTGEVERSHTEYQVEPLTYADKQPILQVVKPEMGQELVIDLEKVAANEADCPGFAISFNTVSETGERVSMSLKALFVLDAMVTSMQGIEIPPPPVAAEVVAEPIGETMQGFYLRDEGYSEAGAIAGRFTYQPTRRTLEMTTYYRQSVAVDQMRILTPDLRLRTIVTYQRPETGAPSVIDLVGFGVERKQ